MVDCHASPQRRLQAGCGREQGIEVDTRTAGRWEESRLRTMQGGETHREGGGHPTRRISKERSEHVGGGAYAGVGRWRVGIGRSEGEEG